MRACDVCVCAYCAACHRRRPSVLAPRKRASSLQKSVCRFFDPSRRYRFHRTRDEELQRITSRYYLLLLLLLHTYVWPNTTKDDDDKTRLPLAHGLIYIAGYPPPPPHTHTSRRRSGVYVYSIHYKCLLYIIAVIITCVCVYNIVSLADCRVRVPTYILCVYIYIPTIVKRMVVYSRKDA